MNRLDPDLAASEWRRILDQRSGRNRRRWLGVTLLVLVVSGGVALGLVSRERIVRSPLFTIQEIDLTGNKSVSDSEIFDILALRAGDPWWRVSRPAIETRRSLEPWIKDIRLSYAWYHTLRVEVIERQPSMAVLTPLAGDLTADGWFVRSRPAALADDLPILRPAVGATPAPGTRADRQSADVARLMDDLRSSKPDLWKEISEVEMREDCACAYLRSGNAVVLFLPGVHEDFWKKVPVILEDLRRQGREAPVVDLRFQKGILVHLPEAVLEDSVALATKGRA